MTEVADSQLESYFKEGVKIPSATGCDFYFNILAQVVVKSGLYVQASAYLQRHAGAKKPDALVCKLLEQMAESSLDFDQKEKEKLATFLWSDCIASPCREIQMGAANVLVKLTEDPAVKFSKNPLADIGLANEFYSNSPVEPYREAMLALHGTLLTQVLEDEDIEFASKVMELNQAGYLYEWTIIDADVRFPPSIL